MWARGCGPGGLLVLSSIDGEFGPTKPPDEVASERVLGFLEREQMGYILMELKLKSMFMHFQEFIECESDPN